MIITRYPSNVSPNAVVYGTGTGESVLDPVLCTINLVMSGAYILYIKYTGTDDDNELNLSFDVMHPLMSEWYPILDNTTGLPLVRTLTTTTGDTDYFRIPIVDSTSSLYIPASERYLRIKAYAGADTVEAEMIVNLISAIRPTEQPYRVEGGLRPNTGSIKVLLSGGSGNATWKIYHDTQELDSGDTRNNLGVGSQLITITDGATSYYESFDVVQDTITTYSYTIT